MADDLHAVLEAAIELHRAGDVQAARPLYRQALEANPDDWDALYLLGTAELQLGNFAECVDLLSRVVAERPDVPDAHNNLGVASKALGRWEEAARAFQAAIKANPDYEQAFFNLGALMEQRGLFADAEKCYRRAIELNPGDAQARLCLGSSLKSQEKWCEAEACYREVARHDPRNLDLFVDLGYVLVRQEKLDEAAEVYRQILEVRPDYHEIHNNLSYLYERQGRLEPAVASARSAIELRPDSADAHNNLGIALRSLHQLDDACEAFEDACRLRTGFALAEFNFATTKLLAGDFAAGWPGYERRTETLDAPPRRFPQPRWQGEPLAGKSLFVYADQGFGDTLQFVRFLPQAKERSQARIVFECQRELASLLAEQGGIDELVCEGDQPPSFDSQIPLASLPGLFGVDLDSIPAEVPYIHPPAELRDELNEIVEEVDSSRLRVGLVWQGNPQQARDVLRSCPLDKLLSLAEVAGVSLFSLQTGEPALEQLVRFDPRRRPIDIGSRLRDFAETAAVISRLDLVISVDTATAHLAGALGTPVWTLLSQTPDWRWLLDREDSPWYPTMRLFRQRQWGDWDGAVREVGAELRRMVEERGQ